jgi:hypothetical protein
VGRPRRVLERDERGTPITRLDWRSDGTLAEALVRLPGGPWLRIEPGATDEAPWGRSDRVWLVDDPERTAAGTPLTVFAAVDYRAVDHVPPLFEPERLPPGGGTAILNLLATLAAAQGRARLGYRGPYPTEQLFLALLESFRYVPPAGRGDPLAAFMAGGLAWAPAPHTRRFAADGTYVQRRGRVEKVVWRGRTYVRPDWQDVTRHAPRRVRDTGDGVCCSLWALEAAIEDHLLLDAGGEPARVLAPPPDDAPAAALEPALAAGVVALAAAMSAPALAPLVRSAGAGLALEWGPVAGDLVAVTAGGVRLSTRLRARIDAFVAAAPARADAAARALAAVGELARLAGDPLRARARDALARRPAAEQARALAAPPAADAADAPRISAAVRALLARASS